MEKVGLFHFVAEPYLMDFRGRVTLPMIGNYLIHAASSHAGERGFGFNDMSERHTAWVLSRLAIEMKEYPTAFDKINLYTWIDEVGRLFTSRCFELADENGKTFGFARSIWAAIDVETRRPTLLDIEALGKYIDERPCPIEKPGKIMPAENKAEGIPYSIKYSDLDINGHFNSVKYIEHLLDLFDIDQFKTREIGRLADRPRMVAVFVVAADQDLALQGIQKAKNFFRLRAAVEMITTGDQPVFRVIRVESGGVECRLEFVIETMDVGDAKKLRHRSYSFSYGSLSHSAPQVSQL